jgi:competence protein ComEA
MNGPAPIPTPPPAVSPSQRHAQTALAAFVLVLVGLLVFRTYAPRTSARPTEDLPAIPSASRPVDLNTADRAELLQLPGVGPTVADAILAHRADRGRFDTVDDLTAVHGVGGKTLDKLRPLLTASAPPDGVDRLERKPRPEPPPPPARGGKMQPGEPKIDVNAASEAELQRLPRVGPVMAAAIAAARREKRFETVDDLRRVKGLGAKTLDALRPFVTVGAEQIPPYR